MVCTHCGERPGVIPRWSGDASTGLVCEECHAAATARAAAWTSDRVTHAAIWRCWAHGCGWSFVWTASRGHVDRDLVLRIARDQMLVHARVLDGRGHDSLVRQLWRLTQISPSETIEL